MSWDERQRAMLAEMGLRLPPLRSDAAVPAVDDAPPAAARPQSRRDAAVDERADPPPELPAPPPAQPAARAARPASPAAEAAVAPAPQAASAALPGLETLGLEALREALPSCQACGLCGQRRLPVFGAGAGEAAARWLVVTDPSDEADDAAGQPLVGDAGRLLDRMLAAVGERRSGESPGAFVTPLVKCRPARGRAPNAAELEACEAILARQLALLQPRVLLAMGPQAARRLTGSAEPLGRLRGRVHQWHGTPLVVTYHPAYLLRSAADKAGAWEDLCLARSILNP
ncbi:MAG: uracil-DNA glycosylase [Roseateles depolymerans]|uniref:Uracil-DNA glycosylase n=1 Tax=Roseateles depolymerans TaxID=76731 RepID=A0A2W5DA69_9BURK|nr:MAG: uracil-DNA glycosylase [Roseateles depolymerans]